MNVCAMQPYQYTAVVKACQQLWKGCTALAGLYYCTTCTLTRLHCSGKAVLLHCIGKLHCIGRAVLKHYIGTAAVHWQGYTTALH